MLGFETTAGGNLEDSEGGEPPEEPDGARTALSHGQRSLWFLHHLAPVGGAYNIAAAARVLSPVDAGTLERAFQALVDRHAALRTTFPAVDGAPRRQVAEDRKFSLARLDVTGWSVERLRSHLTAEAWRPFDLERGPLLRVTLLTGGIGGPVILLVIHHVVADFWSLAVLFRELPEAWRQAAGEGPARLGAPGASYEEHVRREEEALAGGRGEALLAYWKEKLAGLAPLELSTDRPRPAVQTYRGDTFRLRLPGTLAAALRARSRAQRGTLFMTLAAALQVLLGRHTGQEDLAIGAPRSGRSDSQFAGTMGYFVNPVVLRGDLSGDPTFAELFERTRETVLAAFEHGDIPLPLLVESLQPVRDAGRTPLFQVSLVLQKETRGAEGLTAFALGEEGVEIGPEGFRLESLSLPHPPSPFDLMLHAVERQGGLSFALQYNADLFDGTTAARLLERFAVLLRSVAESTDLALSALPILPEAERHQLLGAWNDTAGPETEADLYSLFAAQVERTPDSVAVAFEDEQVTYRELLERTTALARHLADLGVGPEVLVGVAAERSVDMVISLLGVLGAGGAYLPLEPSLPAQRLEVILEDARPAVLLSQRSQASVLPGIVPTVPGMRPSTGNTAYVIYTSGSTGRPKGVVNSHRGILNRLLWMRDELGLGSSERFLQKTPFGFDVSVPELFTPLILGARLVMARPDGHRDAAYLVRLVQQEGITTIHFVPSMLPFFLAEEGVADCRSLRRVLVSGEAFPWETEQRCLQTLPVPLINLYGPTEAAVEVTAWTCEPAATPRPVPIGRPVRNTQIHVVGRRLETVPSGGVGELAIGGVQVARGYLGRPDLTAERFVPDPFSPEPGSRLYRTGDLCRHLHRGEIEYLGRLDDQVKIRGFRIEPREIEIALVAHPQVREAAVVVRQGALLACVVPREAEAAPAVLRDFLAARLPSYMVPAFAFGEALDRLPNGKLDRRALARWTPAAEPVRQGLAPRTPHEEMLAGLFAEVLGVERIGLEDDFFEQGGHSLAAMRLLARLRETIGIDLPLSRVFETPTVAALARAIEGADRGVALPLTAGPRGGPLPLSFAQQRLWFLDRLDPESPVYNMPAAVELAGRLDAAALEAALAEVVRRHEALRTSIRESGGEPVQVVSEHAAFSLSRIDLRHMKKSAEEERRLIAGEARRPFDLGKGPLLRAALLRPADERHVLLLTLHHIVSDGWSMGVLVREVGALYAAFLAGRPSPLPELEIQPADLALWQRRHLSGVRLEAELAWWRGQLAGMPAALDLPADHPRPAARSSRGAVRGLVIDGATSGGLAALSRRQGTTLFMTLLAGFASLLHRWTGAEDLAVGTPVAGRTRVEAEPLIGLFVNTVALRTDLSGDPRLADLLGRVRKTTLAAYAHQEVPFERIVEDQVPERDLSRTPLVQVMLVLQNAPLETLRLPGLSLAATGVATGTAKLDLTCTLTETEDGLTGEIEYSRDLFEAPTIARLAGHFARLLAGAVDDPRRRLSELPLLSDGERAQLLVEWNDTGMPPAPDTTLHGLFEIQAARTPEAVALVAGATGERWTYRELDLWADRLAHQLAGRGVGPEVRVGVSLPRTPLLVATLLGVLKAGGAYVPLDPEYPRERLDFLIEDSGAAVVIKEDPTDPSDRTDPSELSTLCHSAPGNLAFLIYTSGSTGRPKGVAIEHRSAVAFARWARTVFPPEDLAGVLASTSVSFDLSVFELFVTLAWGGKVILAANALELPQLIRMGAAAGEVTLVNTVPSAMAELVRQRALPPSVRTVNLAGEPLKRSLVDAIHESSPTVRVLDLYGPSESTTYSTWAPVSRENRREPSIGRPVAGTRAVLLGRRGELVPAGVPGELWLGGAGLARGYLGRPDLTAERFAPDPFSPEPGERLYRTGDLARYLPDGRLDYLGRIDQQVKVRGFRIELGEVEAALLAHGAVREAAVLAREDLPGGRGLAAFVVAAPPSPGSLRDFLRERLPEFMVPAAFVFLDALPLTPNGKVDRKALAKIPLEREAGREGAAPGTPTEELLAGIFAEVLGLDRVDVEESFFALGGHSLLATQVTSRVRSAFGVELPVRTVFEAPTVAGLAARLAGADAAGGPPVERVPRSPSATPLSFAQQRLWFLDQLEPGSAAYNIPVAVELSGPLDPAALESALAGVVRRHEVLRTTFPAVAGEPVPVVAEDAGFSLPLVDVSDPEEAERLIAAEARRPFDLGRGPLLRALLLRTGSARHKLVLTLHHIVSDGWSMGVLVREIGALYSSFQAGRPGALPDLPVQYADFAAWQRRRLSGALLEAELAWWRERLAGLPPALELPADHPRPAVRGTRGGVHAFALGQEIREALAALSRRHGATSFMTLLAVFAALLQRLTGQDDLAVGAPVAGRTRAEVEPLIGLFVNTLVLRVDLAGDPGFLVLLTRVRTATLAAYGHQEVPFERLVEELVPERDASRPPVVQVLFALQNTPPVPLALPGLGLTMLPVATETAKLDLSLVLAENADAEGGLAGTLEHSRDLFDRTTMIRFAESFERLLAAALAAPEARLAELPLLAPAERAALLGEWNDTATAPHRGHHRPLVHDLVLAWARRQPEALAVAGPGARLTYGELAARAGRLARRLVSAGAGPEARVALCAGSTVDRVVGSLAVLLAGAAYVPLDPEAPAGRLAFQVEDSGAVAVLAERRLGDRFQDCAARVIPLEERGGEEEVSLPPSTAGPDHLAYVVYTSGSTGRPKGVAISHAGLLNLVEWHIARYALEPADRATLFANPAFDASVWEIWPYLAAGASLHIPGDEVRLAPEEIVRFWRSEEITWSFLPTPLAEEVIAEPAALAGLSLEGLLCGGDRLHQAPRAGLPFALINHYGPSEVSVVTTAAEIAAGSPGVPPEMPPIGRPIDNLLARVVDAQGALVPLGGAGELWIGGAGLARGYLGRPDLTAERFVPDPWSGDPGERLYRTGDRVRHRTDGGLEFLGRIDQQIKLRGFRIEPGEIEAILLAHPAVSEAVVEVRAGRLVAWVAGREVPPSSESSELRDLLRARLPGYMVPSAFVTLPALPLTPNGKLDRKALPAPAATGRETAAPRTPAEERIAEIFGEVLGEARVGVDDDFFALGGHSLLAAKVVSRIRGALGVELPVRAIFETPTVAGLASRIGSADGGETILPLVRVSRDQPLALSFAQQRFWFLEKIDPGAAYFHLAAALDGEGRLDPGALAGSLGEILRRHEVLRTRFVLSERRPLQIPLSPEELAAAPILPVIDLGGLPAPEGEVARWTAAAAGLPFDFERGPLLRAALLRLGPERHRLLLTVHHIAADAWSIGLLIEELGHLYAARVAGRPSPLPELPVQYADYAVWQRERLRGDRLEEPLRYWRERLTPLPPALELPTDRPRPPVRGPRGARRPVHLDAAATEGMRRLGGQAGVTLFMAVLAVFQAVLGRHAGQDDVAVGTAVADRPDPALEGVIGFFLNTLVLRGDLSGDPAFRDLLAQTRETVLGALAHAELPFEQLVEALQPERDLSRSPLFQVFFALRSERLPVLALPGLTLRPAGNAVEATQFDLSLHLEESAGGGIDRGIGGWIEYSPDLFDAATVERLALHCGVLLAGGVAFPGGRLSALPLLSEPERAQLLAQWNDTQLAVPEAAHCIHDLVRLQAERTPDAVAAIDAEAVLTYHALEERSAWLAHRLARLGVRPGDRVGVCVERSLAMLVSMLGILRAGAAYVPLDPAYPQARLAAMLEDSQAAALVASPGAPVGHPRTLAPEAAEASVPGSKLPEMPAEAAAYVIYTSGSTGVPKGVVVSHRNAAFFFAAMDVELQPEGPGVWLAVTSICFDISVLELLWTLTRGFRVVIHAGGPEIEGASVAEQIALHGVTHLQCTPSMAGMLSATPERLQGLAPLSRLLLGGEALPAALAERLGGAVRGEIHNLYGPTETTVWSLAQRVEADEAKPLIGRPIANTEVYLLDAFLRPVPPGSSGEVFLGGEGVARGYWRRPDLTAERFLPDPLGSRPGGRLYRTGDLARHRPDGRLDFLGRSDHQVKVRGVRMELGEIETVLATHPAVAQAVAGVREDGRGGSRLVAWLVPAAGGANLDLAAGDLRRHLAERLPEAMIPSVFVPLAALPLTRNGKIDRRALPAPEAGRPRLESIYAAPRTPVEKTLAAIWQEVLGHERVGIHDNFFEMGGSSLLLAEIEARLREAFGREIPVVLMFRNPTIHSLAREIGARELESREREPVRAVESPPPRGEPAAEGSAVDRQRQFLEDMKRRRAQQRRPAR